MMIDETFIDWVARLHFARVSNMLLAGGLVQGDVVAMESGWWAEGEG